VTGLRALPHNAEAEAAVLGGVLLRGRDALLDIHEYLDAEDFYMPAYQSVYRAMLALDADDQPIDVVTLEARLKARGELRLVGGIEGLSKLGDRYATTHNIRAHAKLIREAALVRSLIVTAREIAQEGMDEVEDIRAFLDEAEHRVLQINENRKEKGYRASRELVLSVFRQITERHKRQNPITGVPSGFAQLDKMTAGLQPGDLIIIAARPGMGKTSFALNIAQNAAILQAKHAHLPEDQRPTTYPVLFFSLEMAAEQLIERILCSEARVDYSSLRAGNFVEADFRNLVSAADRLAPARIYIDDTAAPTILDIRNISRRWRSDRHVFPPPASSEEEHGPPLGLIVVDYLQLARGAGKHNSREQEIAEISRGLKGLAKELRVPVIALSQLNRAVDSRTDHRPVLSDLRESGAIEQDADLIMFIYREERYLANDATEEQRRAVENKAELIVGKQRNGPVGTVPLNFIKRHTRFENPAADY
jgi:replicative DNA helicase